MSDRWPTLLIAGGGTGGHVFPGLALADAARALTDVNVVFVGSPRGLETRVVPEHGYTLELLDVEPMKGGGMGRAVRGALVAAKAMRHASTLVRRLKPACAISVGGYAAGPASLACVSMRVPLAILEPNAPLGLANRVLAPFAKRAYLAWDETSRMFPPDKVRILGVPLRRGFEPRDVPRDEGSVLRVLVLGGSQGARAINERLPTVLARVSTSFQSLEIVHQAGRDRHAGVRDAYAQLGVKGVTVAPFLDDVAAQMTRADVVIARSGAVTVAEIAAIGRPSVLIPFPHAAGDHQAKNALALASAGGSVCMREESWDDDHLVSEITDLLADPARRERMGRAARDHGRPHAAHDIALDLLSFAGIQVRGSGPGSRRYLNGQSKSHSASKEVS